MKLWKKGSYKGWHVKGKGVEESERGEGERCSGYKDRYVVFLWKSMKRNLEKDEDEEKNELE